MKLLDDAISHFLLKQGFAIITTVDEKGYPHSACKDIAYIDQDGDIYVIDLYKGKTMSNLLRDDRLSVTSVDEHRFKGYSVKGRAVLVPAGQIKSHVINAWEDKMAKRLANRIIRELKDDKGHKDIPEAGMPSPEYLMIIRPEEIVDLTPPVLK